MKRAIRFLFDEKGLEITEYAVMGALICLGMIPAVATLSTTASTLLTRITDIIISAIP